MTKIIRGCYQNVTGSSYPRKPEDWKRFVCDEGDFVRKNEKITECFQQQVGPEEEALFVKNLNVSKSEI